MKKQLIKDLEDLLNTEDKEKIQRLKKSIVDNHVSDSKNVMQRVNMYTDTPDKQTRKGIEDLIEDLKKQEQQE